MGVRLLLLRAERSKRHERRYKKERRGSRGAERANRGRKQTLLAKNIRQREKKH